MHFWSVWGKIKPRNDENTLKYVPKGLSRWSWPILALTTPPRLLPEVLGLGFTWDSISSFWPLSSSRIDPDPHRRPFHSFLCIFSSFLGFILPQTDQKCTFYTIFSSKWPSGRYEASSNWIFAPRSILSPRMISDPKDGLSKHKIHLISSFLGFILPKTDQKCTF